MDKKQKLKELLISGKKRIISSVLFAFTIFVFAPIELYLSNNSEFWFSFFSLLPIFLFCSIITIFIITILLSYIPDKVANLIEAFLYAVSFLIYIQGNYIPNDYGTLNGEEIQWDKYSFIILLDSLFWIIIIVAAAWLVYRYKESALMKMRFASALLTAIELLSVLIIGLLSIGTNEKDENRYLSKEGMFTISSGTNTVVFLLDCFDSEVMNSIVREQSEMVTSTFKDFIFYRNTVGGATRTKYALPYIFTGIINTEEIPYSEYKKKAFSNSPLIKGLISGDYESRIFTVSEYFDLSQDISTINNIAIGENEVSSIFGLSRDYFRILGFKYAPDVLKKNFWIYSGDLNKWKKQDGNDAPYVCGDDFAFYNELTEQKLIIDTDKPSLRFYHLKGDHPPYNMNENSELIETEKGTEKAQAIGSLNIVSEYISQMKELGIYDSATIIVMSDHGAGRGVEQNPLFMLKSPYSNNKFEISDVPLSYKNLNELLLASIEGDYNINDYITYPPRYFYVAKEEQNRLNIIEYVSYGAAYDAEGFKKTGIVYNGDTDLLDQEYTLGSRLSFAEEGDDARRYIQYGFSMNELTHTWTDGEKASLKFVIKEKFNNLQLDMEYYTFLDKERVELYVNDHLVSKYTAKGEETRSIIIPKEYVSDGEVWIELLLPDAKAPIKVSNYNHDSRELALAFKNIQISDTKSIFDLNSQIENSYRIGDKIMFTLEDKTGEKYLNSGFSGIESDGVWTSDYQADMYFFIDDVNSDLQVNVSHFAYGDKQDVSVYANDVLVEKYVATGKEDKTFNISSDLVKGGILTLRFALPDAVSPKSLGKSDDARTLALKLSSLEICNIPKYKYGTDVLFRKEDNSAKEYIVSGFSDAEQEFSWTDGYQAELAFPIEKSEDDIDIIFYADSFNGKQRAIFSINGDKLEEIVIAGEKEYTLRIPAKYTNDGLLNIRIDLPDSESPYTLGLSNDKRILGLRFISMKIILD